MASIEALSIKMDPVVREMERPDREPVREPTPRLRAVERTRAEEIQEKPGREPLREDKTEKDAGFLQDMLHVVEEHMSLKNVGLKFSVHEKTGLTMVTVLNKETEEVIREVPPEQVLDIIAKIDEMMGMLFDEKA